MRPGRGSGRLDLNLARRPFFQDRPVVLLSVLLFLLGGVALAADGHFLARYFLGRDELREDVAALELETAELGRRAQADRAALARVDAAELAFAATFLNTKIRERSFSWTALLSELGRAQPPEIRLTQLTPRVQADGHVMVRVRGLARNPEVLLVFLDQLIASPAFEYPRLLGENDQERGVPEGRQFDLEVHYRFEQPGAPVKAP